MMKKKIEIGLDITNYLRPLFIEYILKLDTISLNYVTGIVSEILYKKGDISKEELYNFSNLINKG